MLLDAVDRTIFLIAELAAQLWRAVYAIDMRLDVGGYRVGVRAQVTFGERVGGNFSMPSDVSMSYVCVFEELAAYLAVGTDFTVFADVML